jgi:hypothetical protein
MEVLFKPPQDTTIQSNLLFEREEALTNRSSEPGPDPGPGGAARLIEVLDAQRTVDDVYLGYAGALADRARALIALQRAAAAGVVKGAPC